MNKHLNHARDKSVEIGIRRKTSNAFLKTSDYSVTGRQDDDR